MRHIKRKMLLEKREKEREKNSQRKKSVTGKPKFSYELDAIGSNVELHVLRKPLKNPLTMYTASYSVFTRKAEMILDQS